MGEPDYLRRILASRVYDVARVTPVHEVQNLSRRMNNRILVKREDLQPVFSFKLRGAYNKIALLDEQARARGVIAASAGNHAQGVALAAQKLGIRATIVMPRTTPAIKVTAVRRFGAEVALHGDTFDEAAAQARDLERRHGWTFIHPYDDPDVIAGQGTVAMELLQQEPSSLEAVFVPCGGGGLLAGIAACIKQVRPEIKVFGVEAEESACLYHALEAGERVILPHVGIFADGVAVAQIGEETFRIARTYVDGVIRVSTDAICAAIKDIYDDLRCIAEPAGALALAGLKQYAGENHLRQSNLLAILSGANVNFHRLRHISERSEYGEQTEGVFAVTIPERPGSFLAFCEALNHRNITEFNYRFGDADEAHIYVGVQLNEGPPERQLITEGLNRSGYRLIDLSDNEVAKLHLRHMVGGHGKGADHEVLFRFQFPERPGALLRFLNQLGGRWNISLFHYRNHGSAYGRVLAGFQVPPNERKAFHRFLDDLGYPYWEESDNPAYHLFLDRKSVV